MFGDILQPTHLIFILVVALLVLGPKRLPEVGRSLGKGLRDFRGALSGLEDETSDLRSTMTTPLESTPVTPATVSVDEEPAPESVATQVTPPDSVATQVMSTPSPAPATVPLDAHGVETAAVDAARVTASETAAHAGTDHPPEPDVAEHPEPVRIDQSRVHGTTGDPAASADATPRTDHR